MFFIHFYVTHLIFFAPNLMVFRAHRHSPSPRLMSHDSHLSHSHVWGIWRKREIKEYLDILDKGEFDAEIDPLSFWKEKSGRFSNLSGIALQYLAMPATSASAERLFSCSGLSCKGKKTNVSSVLLESQTLCRFNKKFDINPQSVFFFSVIEIVNTKRFKIEVYGHFLFHMSTAFYISYFKKLKKNFLKNLV